MMISFTKVFWIVLTMLLVWYDWHTQQNLTSIFVIGTGVNFIWYFNWYLCFILTEYSHYKYYFGCFFFLKIGGGQAWWRAPLLPAAGRQTQADLCKFKASLVYRATQIEPSRVLRLQMCHLAWLGFSSFFSSIHPLPFSS